MLQVSYTNLGKISTMGLNKASNIQTKMHAGN